MGSSARIVERIRVVLLGPEGMGRQHSAMTLMALCVYVLFAAFQHLEVVLGLIDRGDSNRLSAFYLTGSVVTYLLVRSGLADRLRSDPALNKTQMVFAMVSIAWSYAITGPARGAVMSIMILVILFGIFRLDRRATRRLAMLGLGMLASVMAWRAWQAPERYDPRVEFIHFVFAAIVMGGTATLSMWFGAMRERLSRQRKELAQALELNRELATRDGLTGLLNRRAATELLLREHARLVRGQGPLALALLDIDHFKRINDACGHAAGDEVLQAFADVLGRQLRAADVLARWGGEEFLLVLPGTALADAAVLLERLRGQLREAGLAERAGGLAVTFSAGLVQCTGDEAHDAAVARADRALYRAKHLGRDRIELDPPRPGGPTGPG